LRQIFFLISWKAENSLCQIQFYSQQFVTFFW